MYLNDYWYAIALSRDVAKAPLARRALEKDIVLFRDGSGVVSAMEDLCPHRLVPLSAGTRSEEGIRCRYHGFLFNCAGECIEIPGETAIPATVRVPIYPAEERYGLVWVWMGPKEEADPDKIVEWPWMGRDGFVSLQFDNRFDAPFSAIVDNLLDLTHVHFTHRLLGADNLIHDSDRMEVWKDATAVHFSRKLRKAQRLAPGTYLDIGGSFQLPSICYSKSVVCSSEDNQVLDQAPISMIMHCLTPEDEHSTRYVAIRSWNVETTPEDIQAAEHRVNVTVQEDKEILEAQYEARRRHPHSHERLIRADQAAVQARRAYEDELLRQGAG